MNVIFRQCASVALARRADAAACALRGLDDFADGVIPERQRRGLSRRDGEGSMLREHLGLPRPDSRSFRPAD